MSKLYKDSIPNNDAAERAPSGFINLTLVTHKSVPMYAAPNSAFTFGNAIDAQLEEAAMAGEEVLEVALEISKDAWANYASAVRK